MVFEEADYALYLDMLVARAARAQCEVWAYCLMPNHAHIILVPSEADGLRRTFADLHRRYNGYVNVRVRTTAHLWQGRYGSVDEAHLFHAIRYVTLNPVRQGWSSVPSTGIGPWCSMVFVEVTHGQASVTQGDNAVTGLHGRSFIERDEEKRS